MPNSPIAAPFRLDGVADRVWPGIPQPTEWQRSGDKIGEAMLFTKSGEDAGSGEALMKEWALAWRWLLVLE